MEDDDLMDQLPDVTETRRAPATAVRVTPPNESGTPKHDWGLTYRFDQPVWLHLVTVRSQSEVRAFDPSKRYPFDVVDRVDAALVVPHNHQALGDVRALAHGLWQHRHTGAAVEAWGESGPGTWWYALVPSWRDVELVDFNERPLELPEEHRVYAAGNVARSTRWAWPDPAPLADPDPVGPFAWFVLGTTEIEPPAQGFPERRRLDRLG